MAIKRLCVGLFLILNIDTSICAMNSDSAHSSGTNSLAYKTKEASKMLFFGGAACVVAPELMAALPRHVWGRGFSTRDLGTVMMGVGTIGWIPSALIYSYYFGNYAEALDDKTYTSALQRRQHKVAEYMRVASIEKE